MTRINVGYPVNKLTRQHLIAEHREIKRIPNMVRTGRARIENIPEKFCLGTGHCKFFYNKLAYLLKRYKKIYKECIHRGYNVQNYESAWAGISKDLMQDYMPSNEDKDLIVERINSKLNITTKQRLNN